MRTKWPELKIQTWMYFMEYTFTALHLGLVVLAQYIIIFNLTAMMTKCQKLLRKCQQYAHGLSKNEKNNGK